jgi:7,8-dihydropterin-6-yl-methyl-4-(beta-D-ribofuranosyl)aminobenzene 5'-phosphate synthase
MLRKLLILILLVAGVTACSSSSPATAPTRFPTLPPSAIGDLKLTILYDSTAVNSQLKTDWGFAALVEYGDHTLLFDTGANGSILLNNMRQLDIDPQSIEAVILSHEHNDHTGGLQALLDTGVRPTVYVPAAFGVFFKRQVNNQTKLIEVTDAVEIIPGVHTTGLPFGIAEEALVVETGDGAVVLTGCAHPGVAEMVRQAQAVTGSKIAYLVGGFHLYQFAPERVPPIVAELHKLGVEKVLPAHCTGDATPFRTEFGDNFIEGGVGRTVTISAK